MHIHGGQVVSELLLSMDLGPIKCLLVLLLV